MNEKIVICAGHEDNNDGTKNDDLDIFEHDMNNLTADLVYAKLQEINIECELIKDVSLGAKCRMVNTFNPAAAIDIHYNAAPEAVRGKATGYEAYHYPTSFWGKKLAEAVVAGFKDRLPFEPHAGGVIGSSKFMFLRKTICPAIITEGLFLDNTAEATFLTYPRGPETMAQAVYQGLIHWFRERAQQDS